MPFMSNCYQIHRNIIDHWLDILTKDQFKVLTYLYVYTIHGEYIKFSDLLKVTRLDESALLSVLDDLTKYELITSLFPDDNSEIAFIKINEGREDEENLVDFKIETIDPVTLKKETIKVKSNKIPPRRIAAQKFIQQKAIRDKVLQRDNYKCVYCGTTEHLTIDHVIPITKNGADDLSNLQTLCKSCNSMKSNK